MTNEEYILSQISERNLADMSATGNIYHTDLNKCINAVFNE